MSALAGTAGPGFDAVRARVRRRHAVVTLSLGAALLVVVAVGLSVGDYPLSPAQIWRTLWGGGEPVEAYVLLQVRAPRVVMGALVGASLGVAGALLQTLLRNPLARPHQ